MHLPIPIFHTETGEVRSFWPQQANDEQRESMLKQADKLNGEGYGVYFAPCLRREKKGSAASAALVPALWVDVDCDGDQPKRDRELAKLREFEPVPSVNH
ncbi:MAG: hypothetical protein HUU03_11045 [Planctomycetaceae bacterium]|nr:hypothetical protein [Planctomycetaceae bacterium]